MTCQKLKSHIEIYKNLLLELFPVCHGTGFSPIFTPSYIKKKKTRKKTINNEIKTLETELKLRKNNRKADELELKKEELSILQQRLKEAIDFEKVKPNILKGLHTAINTIDTISDIHKIPRFRYSFNEKYDFTDLTLEGSIDERISSIVIDFTSYLDAESKTSKQDTIKHKITKKMTRQLKEYCQENEKDLKKLSNVIKRKKKKHRISDNKFKQLCKEVERGCPRKIVGGRAFFNELSKMSKDTKYDKTARGYKSWQSAKKRYYEVFPSKKANQ